jgi:histidine triad (HIT) family protein
MEVAQAIGRAIQRVHNPAKVGLMIAGLEVPHLHIHVVPIDGVGDLDFANAAASVEMEYLEEQAESVREALNSMGIDGVAG